VRRTHESGEREILHSRRSTSVPRFIRRRTRSCQPARKRRRSAAAPRCFTISYSGTVWGFAPPDGSCVTA
jgi:hypothetical protein